LNFPNDLPWRVAELRGIVIAALAAVSACNHPKAQPVHDAGVSAIILSPAPEVSSVIAEQAAKSAAEPYPTPSARSTPSDAAATAMCGSDRTGDSVPWIALPRLHAAYPAVRRFTSAFATREVAKVAAMTGLPLHVRYPGGGGANARELDEQATDSAARRRVLGQLLRHLPVPVDEDPDEDDVVQLGKSTFIDMDPTSTDSSLRVRVCVDYDHSGDGTFNELELTLAREGARGYVIHAVQIGWFRQ
jgi:hypothetical protein